MITINELHLKLQTNFKITSELAESIIRCSLANYTGDHPPLELTHPENYIQANHSAQVDGTLLAKHTNHKKQAHYYYFKNQANNEELWHELN